jgi:hypothetical protein
VIHGLVVRRVQQRGLAFADAFHDFGHDGIAAELEQVALLELGEAVFTMIEPRPQFGARRDLLGPEVQSRRVFADWASIQSASFCVQVASAYV